MKKKTVSARARIVRPADVREQDRTEPEQESRRPPQNAAVVDWLLACPEKGFFVPIVSESTDMPWDTSSTRTS